MVLVLCLFFKCNFYINFLNEISINRIDALAVYLNTQKQYLWFIRENSGLSDWTFAANFNQVEKV